ncbi:MAG: ATP-binding protein [Desulfitobacteriaceae bacterium]
MTEIFQLNTLSLYFIYGLSFYTMGIAVTMHYRSYSRFSLAYSMPFLAAFGLLHGLSEWGSVFIPANIPNMDMHSSLNAIALQRILQSISLLFLFCFGIKLISDSPKQNRLWFILPIAAFLAWLIQFARFIPLLGTSELKLWLLSSESWTRYLLAFPAGISTAYGLFLQLRETKKINDKSVLRNLWGSIAAFFLFAIFSGLVVSHPLGWLDQIINAETFRRTTLLPIEAFRTVAALLATWFITRLLTIFYLEELRKVAESRNLETVYRERERFARDLHDDVIQSIYGVGLELQTTTYMLDENHEKILMKVNWAIKSLNQVIQAIRAYIRRLETDDSEQDLRTLLSTTIDHFREFTGPEIIFNYQVKHESRLQEALLQEDWRQQIRQIVREALSNVLHHAKASEAYVDVSLKGDLFRLTIEDNGLGIPSTVVSSFQSNLDTIQYIERTKGISLGLKNMRDRARLLGGTLNIISQKSMGTKVELSIPLG